MASYREDVVERHPYIDLSGAVLPKAKLDHTNLSAANFEGTNLVGANLTMAVLLGANLKKTVLRGANLAFANLTGCDLTGADLSGADLDEAIFRDANLSSANLRNANMQGANFEGAQNLNWRQLLNGRINETTVVPAYLDEMVLVEVLENLYENIASIMGYSNDFPRLWAELNKTADSLNKNSFIEVLLQMQSNQETNSSEVHHVTISSEE